MSSILTGLNGHSVALTITQKKNKTKNLSFTVT